MEGGAMMEGGGMMEGEGGGWCGGGRGSTGAHSPGLVVAFISPSSVGGRCVRRRLLFMGIVVMGHCLLVGRHPHALRDALVVALIARRGLRVIV